MRVLFHLLTLALFAFSPVPAEAARKTFTHVPPGFTAYTVKRGDTWKKITNSDLARELARKINRMNIEPWVGLTVLLPDSALAYAYVPVPEYINSVGRHLVIYEREQYFGAYEDGVLVRWGPVSSGKRGSTPNGDFTAKAMNRRHWSRKYNNARMHFAVQFRGDYFTHEQVLPGYAASHGCVRMMWDDAEWKFAWIKPGDRISVWDSMYTS